MAPLQFEGELDERSRALAEELAAVIAENPLQGYWPHPKQAEFHARHAKIKAFFGGNRSGKTTACVADDVIQAVDEDLLPERLQPFKKWQPPFRCWIGAPKVEKHEDTILPMLRSFLPKKMLRDGNFDKSYSKLRRQLEFTNGSSISLKTYDQDTDAWASAACERIHWDEEPLGQHGVDIRTEARARLISTAGDEIFGMTPLLGLSWVYDEIYEKRNQDGIAVVGATMMDNPFNAQEEIDAFAATLTDEERKARIEGRFVHFGGLFFDEFRDQRHVIPIEEADMPGRIADMEIVVGIDPGLRRTGVVWIAFDSDNSAFVFDEFYPAETVVPDIAHEIQRRNIGWNCEPIYVIDPSARNRTGINQDSLEAAYAREGIYSQFGQNDRAAGILEVKKRLQQGSLRFSSECVTAIWEMQRYRRDLENKDEFAAIKEDDHLVDAIRYVIMARTWVQPPERRRRKPVFQENYQQPYGAERAIASVPPLGPMS